jgi:uncharacterized protein (UPF0548 family)
MRMITLSMPGDAALRGFLARQARASLTYPHAGITRDAHAPPGYAIDHNRIALGHGEAVFRRAVAALRRWDMFDIPWLRLAHRDTPIRVGESVAIIPLTPGLITISPCRIVYVIDDVTPVGACFGFGYGTLPGHVGRGEERFLIEHLRADDSVHYDIFAVSQPGLWLTRLGYPFMRFMQKRFACASKSAMQRAVGP